MLQYATDTVFLLLRLALRELAMLLSASLFQLATLLCCGTLASHRRRGGGGGGARGSRSCCFGLGCSLGFGRLFAAVVIELESMSACIRTSGT